MFDVANTVANAAMAAAVNNRLDADAALNRAKARTWLLFGVGGLLALIGIGTGAAIAGYHFSYQRLRLDDTTLHLETPAPLKLDAGGAMVGLDANGKAIRLDTTGTSVRLDATGATVRLDGGGGTLSRVTTAQPQSGAKVVVDYYTFHQVDFANGRVETGWQYRSSQDAAPWRQYCQYRTVPDATGMEHTLEIAIDGTPLLLPTTPAFDLAAALRNCVWFR
jgi:hypothetical protein